MRARISWTRRDEQGAVLILAIAFLLVVGGIGAAVVSSVRTGLNDRIALDQVRNRQYAADAGIETAIAATRFRMTSGNAASPCPSPQTVVTVDSVPIRVACTYVATTASGYLQRNIVLTAQCSAVQQPQCPNTGVIVRAQVNFASPSILADPSITVTRTYIQSWSVNE
jgi:hypothetical protein